MGAVFVDTVTGVSPDPSTVLDALTAQRTRLLALCRSLDDGDWARPTRCDAWTVHHVVRHLVDVSHIDVANLLGKPPAFPSDQPFDPVTSPLRWLESSEGATPSDTLDAFARTAEEEQVAFAHAAATLGARTLRGPYGQIHWTAFLTHVFWDAWIHERDIVFALGRAHDAEANEDHLAALYGVLVAAATATLAGVDIDTVIALHGAHPVTVRATARQGAVRASQVDEPAALRGELGAVLDALAGRGAPLATVVDGPSETLEPLTWLRAFMAPSPSR